jgi:uncharacterized membrane protein YphA (DoxX/SURF4 family)
MKYRNEIVLTIVTCFILLLVYAALSKLLDYQKFVVQIGQSPLLTRYASFIAWSIPTIEILIAILLAWPRFRFVGLYGAFILMVMFTAYIAAILSFSEVIPCSCGGVLEKLGWKEHLVFNVVFIMLALVGIILIRQSDKQEALK